MKKKPKAKGKPGRRPKPKPAVGPVEKLPLSVTDRHFRIAQWALMRGGSFTQRELMAKFGMTQEAARHIFRSWRRTWKDGVGFARSDWRAGVETRAACNVAPPPVAAPKFTLAELIGIKKEA